MGFWRDFLKCLSCEFVGHDYIVKHEKPDKHGVALVTVLCKRDFCTWFTRGYMLVRK